MGNIKHKRIATYLLLPAIVFAFSGCSNAPPSSAPHATSAPPSSSQLAPSELAFAPEAQEQALMVEQKALQAELKALHAELKKHLGEKTLTLNERYCFYLNDKYVIAGGSGTPVTDLNELHQYYPSWNVPAQLASYSFKQAVIFADDNLTFSSKSAIPQGMKENVVSTIALKTEKIYSFQLEYADKENTLSIAAYPLDSSLSRVDPALEIKEAGDFYTLLQNSETGDFVLHWQDSLLHWELSSTDPLLDLQSFAEKEIRNAVQLPLAE